MHILRVVNGYFLDFQSGNHVGEKMIQVGRGSRTRSRIGNENMLNVKQESETSDPLGKTGIFWKN